jgi:electron transport protein HydN
MNRFVITDPQLCIGCRTCEVACASAHLPESYISGALVPVITPANFYARIAVVKTNQFTAAVMCRQCDDAPCAKVCPTNAIVQEDGFVKVIQSLCIGCKSCELACSTGAMRVVMREVAPTEGGLSSLFHRTAQSPEALKCDVCSHRAQGPACIGVCPTGAISWGDPQQTPTTETRDTTAKSSVVTCD